MPQPGSAPGDGIEELCFQVSTTLHSPPSKSFLMAQLIAWLCLKVNASMVVSSCIDFPLMLLWCWGGLAAAAPTRGWGRGVPSILLQQWEPDPFSEMNGKRLRGETSNELLTICRVIDYLPIALHMCV